jgi:Flp pilus assembly protein TadD
MSVLNRMLHDLESRGATPAVVAAAGVATVARPAFAAPARQSTSRRLAMWVGLLAVIAAVAGTHAWLQIRDAGSVRTPTPLGAREFGAAIAPAVAVAAVVNTATATTPAVAAPVTTTALEVTAPVAAAGPTQIPSATAPKHTPRPARTAAARSQPTRLAALPATRPPAASPQSPAGAAPGAPTESIAQPIVVTRVSGDPDLARAADFIARGRNTEAKAILTKLLQTNPRHAAARAALAALQAEGGSREAALATLLDGVEFDAPRFAPPAAQLQAELGDVPGALVTLARVPASARDGAYHALTAGLAQRAGDPARAVDSYRNALQATKPNPVWWIGLAFAHESLGETTEAQAAYARAMADARLPAEARAFAERKLAGR